MKSQLAPSVSKDLFGKLGDGTEIYAYTLTNQHNMSVKIITYGAIISECWVPDKNQELANLVLGFDSLDGYLSKHPRFGSTIGRYANRIANAQFELDGTVYKLAATKGTTCTHGGVIGFDKKVWNFVDSGQEEQRSWVQLGYLSKDMEEGFPGNLHVSITFSLSENNTLEIHYEASTDKATPLNLTNHSYFNLKGAGKGNILDHLAFFNADAYTPLDKDMIPTGEIESVEDTAFDFTEPTPIGQRITQVEGGYDLNYVIDREEDGLVRAASVMDPESGRTITAYTDTPGFQFFTANGLDGSIVGNGGKYLQYAGFCIETQQFPNSVNQAEFPNSILRPDQKFSSITRYAFSNQS